MDSACSTYTGEKKCVQNLGKLDVRRPLGVPKHRLKLKLILKKWWGWGMWIGFQLFRIGSSDVVL
jgi:hypothetical protein